MKSDEMFPARDLGGNAMIQRYTFLYDEDSDQDVLTQHSGGPLVLYADYLADHDRIVAEAEARGRAKGLQDAEIAVRNLHIASWSTIETGPDHGCECAEEHEALERAERAIAALRKPEAS